MLDFSKKKLVVIFTTIALFAVAYNLKYTERYSIANSSENVKPKVPYLTCPILKERTKDFLKNHYVFRTFDSELSSRTFNMYFKLLDPGKLYFTQDDINSFESYQFNLGKKINNIDCRFITEVFNLYKKRVQESTEIASNLLKKQYDFTKDEFLETDRKKISWVKSHEERVERWRKTVKFIVLNMKETDDKAKISERLLKRYNMIQKEILGKSGDEINALFLNSFALSLDPHSSFLTPNDNAQFQIDFSLKLVGIGATLTSPEGYTTVDAIVPGGAAAKDGRLKKGDKIIAVDPGDGFGMQDVIDMELDKVVQLIRGKEGTVVKLMIMRKDTNGQVQRVLIQITRAVVQIKDSEAKSDVIKVNNKLIGVINLPSFYIDYRGCQDSPTDCRSSANDMLREIRKLQEQKVDGIVVDLRRNGGGDLSEAQRIVGLFIDDPVVTQVEDRDKQVRPLEIDSIAVYRGPLAVLVSRYSASASEIFAGAVQDYGRGPVLGDSRTFGKGTVQTVLEVPSSGGRQTDGAIHVTIAKFFKPSGKSNQEKGIVSNVIIPDVIDATDTGESEYEYALPYTVIKPSRDFKPLQDLQGIISKLQEKSSIRVQSIKEFKDITDAMNKIKNEKNTLLSLKEPVAKKDPKILALDKKNTKKSEITESNLPDTTQKIINPNDVVLKEASFVLTDTIELLNGKTDWTK